MRNFEPISSEIEELATKILDCAFKVHRTLGPGLMESVYEICLGHELKQLGIKFQSQVSLPVKYQGIEMEGGMSLDMLVEDKIILELKAAEKMIPLYDAQLMTYLKLTNLRMGLLINFNVPLLKDGIKRIVL